MSMWLCKTLKVVATFMEFNSVFTELEMSVSAFLILRFSAIELSRGEVILWYQQQGLYSN